MKINKDLKKAMIDMEVSVIELAKQSGITRVWLSHIINGREKGSRKVRESIASALQVPHDDIFIRDSQNLENESVA
jgi:transcriptional regulator with XRE-family HTH domain